MIIFALAQPLQMYQQAVFVREVKSHKTNPLKLRYLWAPLFLFITLLLQIWFKIEIVSKSYQLEAIREEALKNDSQLRQLNLELAVVTHSKKLGEEAAKLGFVAPVAKQIREIKE